MVAEREAPRQRSGGDLAGDEHVVIAEHRIPGRLDAGTVKATRRRLEQSRMTRGVEVGTVVEGIGVERGLDTEVAALPASRAGAPSAQHLKRELEFVGLIIVDQVAALDHGVGRKRPDRVQSSGQHLRGERFLRAKGRLKRRPEPIQEGDPRRGLRVENVGIGDVGDARQNPDGGCAGTEFGPRPKWFAGRWGEDPRPPGVLVGRVQRRAVRVGPRRGRGPAAGRDHSGSGQHLADGLTARDPARHSPASPATTVSRVASRVTHRTARVPATSSPASTAAICAKSARSANAA